MKLEYSIMRYCLSQTYYKDHDKSKTIPLGIMIHETDKDIRKFIPVSDLSTLAKADQEISIEFMNSYINCIDKEIQTIKNFSIKSYIKYFVNDIKFDNPIETKYEDFEEKINELFESMR